MRIRTLLKYLLLFAVILFAADKGLYYMDQDYFKITHIESETKESLTGAEMLDKIKQLQGQNIWYIDTDLIEKKLKNDVRIKNIRIKKVYPDTLRLSIIERTPYMYVILKRIIYVADEEGVIFAKRSEYDIQNKDMLVVEINDENELKSMLEIIAKVDKNFKNITTMIYKDEEALKLLLRDGTVIKTDESVKEEKYNNGYRLYLQLKTQVTGQGMSYVDLRYADYIVK